MDVVPGVQQIASLRCGDFGGDAGGAELRRRNQIANKNPYRSHKSVTEPQMGVDLDRDDGGVERRNTNLSWKGFIIKGGMLINGDGDDDDDNTMLLFNKLHVTYSDGGGGRTFPPPEVWTTRKQDDIEQYQLRKKVIRRKSPLLHRKFGLRSEYKGGES
ncbi:hypothetical protein Vadar_029968 [Vaccinium darrowii]|uniref:Uncharacterized protein n=1 Tax=Vaccinium darrowii TaxID=229202 RepID=A0ACB7Z150_9ERIC|nr:hypothetical protein Vadar_029968 [Vaccinium darrowii]